MKKINYLLVLGLTMLSISFLSAQSSDKCYADDLRRAALAQNPSLQAEIDAAEVAIASYINRENESSTSVVLTIPVVIHIIHNGEDVGEGSNISEEQALSLITRLNEDYRKMNADTLEGSHPFYVDQADTEIEFCLVTEDPDGNPTTGVERYDFEQESWSVSEIDEIVKPETIWDRYNYMNVWSINLDDPDAPGVDGYATFPNATTDTTDGVVILYTAFGVPEEGKSIVATHEVGHYLNLNHIWGDNIPDCGDDLVSDTPPTDNSNEGCPSFPHNADNSCGSGSNGEMFMNYMDYSDAECTVMFSNGQKDRMVAAIMMFRSSLLSSTACNIISSANQAGVLAEMKVFPNPSQGIFSVDLPKFSAQQRVQLSVYDMSGVRQYQAKEESTSQIELDLSNLPTGVYFLRATLADNIMTTRLVIGR